MLQVKELEQYKYKFYYIPDELYNIKTIHLNPNGTLQLLYLHRPLRLRTSLLTQTEIDGC